MVRVRRDKFYIGIGFPVKQLQCGIKILGSEMIQRKCAPLQIHTMTNDNSADNMDGDVKKKLFCNGAQAEPQPRKVTKKRNTTGADNA